MRSEPARVDGTGKAGRRTRGRRAVCSAAAGSLLVLAGLGAAVAGPGVAGAVNNNPPGNPTSPAVSYEADCTNSLAGTQVAPFVTQLDANTTKDTAAPTGATFGCRVRRPPPCPVRSSPTSSPTAWAPTRSR